MGTRQLVVKRAAARPRVAEPLFMAYDSAAHEPARVPTRGPDGHAGHRAAVSRLPGAWARRPRRVRGLRHAGVRSEEHTSELQSRLHLVCRLLLEKKNKKIPHFTYSGAPRRIHARR